MELVHTDVNGPFPTGSLAGSKYFLTIIDDCSKKIFAYTIKSKSEVFEKFEEFKNFAENQTGKRIKAVRSDNGGEYDSKRFDKFAKENGIELQRTIPYTPQQNGVSERYNRTIMERVRALLIESGLADNFWGEAVHTAVHLLNIVPKKGELQSPNEIWNNEVPEYDRLHVFGTKAYGHIPKEKRKKLQEKSEELIFVGYEPNGFRLYNPEKKIVVRKNDVVFLEETTTNESRVAETLFSAIDEHYVVHKAKGDSIPKTYAEALESEQSKEWQEAANEEYNSLLENNTWVLQELPKGKSAVKTKWVFATKENENGEIIRYKARLVAKGYSQIEGIDYQETFAPVVRYQSIRILLSIAAHLNLIVTQMDAVTAFLNGNLKEEIFIEQPEGMGWQCK